MLEISNAENYFVIAAGITVIAITWVVHVFFRFAASNKAKGTSWVLLAALPLLGVGLFFWSTTFPTGHEGMADLSSTSATIMIWSFMAIALFGVVGLLELVLLLFLGTPGGKE